jgi:putative two-component system hydrogenase maturation factor HypX/HoxX
LLTECEPISINHAARIGLVDAIGPREPDKFRDWLQDLAAPYTNAWQWESAIAAKTERLARDSDKMPLSAFENLELAEMALDMFHDRNGFAAKRHNFVLKK